MGSIFRKGSEQSGQSGGLSAEQADIARRQVALAEGQANLTEPLRLKSVGILNRFLRTKQTPGFLDLPQTVSPLAALSLPALGDQQNMLQNQLLQQGSRGGLLQQQLANVALQGGLQRTGLLQQDLLRQEQRDVSRRGIAQQLFGSASDYGTNGLSQAFSGFGQGVAGIGNAAQNLNQLGFQRMQQNQIAQQGIGQLLGKGLGGIMGGPAGSAIGGKIGGGAAGGGGYGGAMGLTSGAVGGMFG